MLSINAFLSIACAVKDRTNALMNDTFSLEVTHQWESDIRLMGETQIIHLTRHVGLGSNHLKESPNPTLTCVDLPRTTSTAAVRLRTACRA